MCLDNSFNLREWVLHIQNGSISCSNLDKFIKISISMSERERESAMGFSVIQSYKLSGKVGVNSEKGI